MPNQKSGHIVAGITKLRFHSGNEFTGFFNAKGRHGRGNEARILDLNFSAGFSGRN
jgi:hypothetical protein